jgi:hypothetical protein
VQKCSLIIDEANPTIEVKNRGAAHDYIASHVCECGGQFHSVEDGTEETEPTWLLGQCGLCGLQKSFHFRFIEEEERDPDFDDYARDRTLPRARHHHYLFGHVVVRQLFLSDPASFTEAFPISPWGELRLRQMWERVGREMLKSTDEVLSSEGLQIRGGLRNEHQFPVIVMPATAGMGEVAFAALLFTPRNEESVRYLVLEHTNSLGKPEDWGVLCEWFADGSRKNHERHCRLDYGEFLSTLDELLDHEVVLGGAGKLGLPKWLPDKDDPMTLSFDREVVRPALCKFAFEEIPRLCANDLDAFVVAVEQGRGEEFLRGKAQLSQLFAASETSLVLADLIVERVDAEEMKVLVVKMPPPLSPPEPAVIVVFYEFERETVEQAYRATDLYTCELTSPRMRGNWLLGRIDGGNHAIIADLPSARVETVIDAAKRHKSGRRLPCDGDVMGHLMLYAMLHSSD